MAAMKLFKEKGVGRSQDEAKTNAINAVRAAAARSGYTNQLSPNIFNQPPSKNRHTGRWEATVKARFSK
jgi:hypothetical protein